MGESWKQKFVRVCNTTSCKAKDQILFVSTEDTEQFLQETKLTDEGTGADEVGDRLYYFQLPVIKLLPVCLGRQTLWYAEKTEIKSRTELSATEKILLSNYSRVGEQVWDLYKFTPNRKKEEGYRVAQREIQDCIDYFIKKLIIKIEGSGGSMVWLDDLLDKDLYAPIHCSKGLRDIPEHHLWESVVSNPICSYDTDWRDGYSFGKKDMEIAKNTLFRNLAKYMTKDGVGEEDFRKLWEECISPLIAHKDQMF